MNKHPGPTADSSSSPDQTAEATLREDERRFRQLAESLPQITWTCQADGACDYLSPQWSTYTGVPATRHLGFGWLEHIHPDDHGPVTDAWNRALREKTVFDLEFRIRGADGVYRWFKTRAAPLRDESGEVVKWFGSNTDIQEQREMREALREQAARLQVLADASRAFAEAGTDYRAL